MTIFQSIQTQFADKDASASAINLARRMTRNNEPDLLQEDFMVDDDCNEKFSHDFCRALALKVKQISDYPLECHEYEDAVILLRRHNSGNNKKKEDIYAGMSPGDRIDAMRAKDEGHLSGAQIKRRMTTRNKGRWF